MIELPIWKLNVLVKSAHEFTYSVNLRPIPQKHLSKIKSSENKIEAITGPNNSNMKGSKRTRNPGGGNTTSAASASRYTSSSIF